MTDRAEAQRRINQIRAFRTELDALAADGVALTPQDRAAIASYHDALLQQLAERYDLDDSETAGQ